MIFFNSQNVTPFCPLLGQIGASPLISQTWIPIPQRYFLPNLVQISSVVLQKKSFKEFTDGDMITIAHFFQMHIPRMLSPFRGGGGDCVPQWPG